MVETTLKDSTSTICIIIRHKHERFFPEYFSSCGCSRMTCSFNEWAAAPDLMKSGEHVSMLLDKTPVCLSGPVSQLLLMRPRCHSDHTYCRLLLNLFPRPLKNTHTHLYRKANTHSHIQPGSIFTQSSHCNLPAFSNSSYTLWRFAVLSISHDEKRRNWETKRLQYVGTDSSESQSCREGCSVGCTEVTQSISDLRNSAETAHRLDGHRESFVAAIIL